MWYLIIAVACTVFGLWAGYKYGAKGEVEVMRAAGYFKQGENWIKSKL